MALWMVCLLVPGQLLESDEFPKPLQLKAVSATVRVVNRSQGTEGSGVLVGLKDRTAYVLTAAHLLGRAGKLEVSTFTADSYPRPARIYDGAEVVARTKDIRDLALLRLTADAPAPEGLPICPARFVPERGAFKALSVGCGAARAPVCILETIDRAPLIYREEGLGRARFWEAAAEQSPGRSGGPLLDRQGRVLGVASGTNSGKGYYCHTSEIHRWLRRIPEGRFLVGDEEKSPGG